MRPHLQLRLALASAFEAVADLRDALDRIHDAADAVANEYERGCIGNDEPGDDHDAAE